MFLAEVGIQSFQTVTGHLDSGFHRNDDFQVTQICKCVTSVSYYLTFIKMARVGATLVARQSVERSVEP